MSDQHQKITTYHVLLFCICFIGTAFAGTVSTLMSVYLPVVVRDLPGDDTSGGLDNISAYINAIFIIGAAVGGFACGVISDRAGRKAGVIVSIASYGLFTLLTGFMNSWWAIVVCRFFSGFGLGGVLVTTTTLMMEEWPKKTKAIFIGILSISIPVGIFSAGVIDYFVSSWRQAFLVGTVPLFIAIVSLWLLRESATWKFEKNNFDPSKKKEHILDKLHRKDLVAGAVIFGTMLIGLWAIFSWLPTWINTLVLNGDGQKERGISMMMLGMGGLAGGFLSGWLINAIGARRSMILSFAICSAMSFLLLKTNHSISNLVYTEIVILAVFFGVSQGVLAVYIPSLFPVAFRGTATGFCFNIGRVFTAIAVLFVGVMVSELGGYGNSLFIFSLVFIVGLVFTFFSKDKKDTTVQSLTGPPFHDETELKNIKTVPPQTNLN